MMLTKKKEEWEGGGGEGGVESIGHASDKLSSDD
jgi:hypothetical protein